MAEDAKSANKPEAAAPLPPIAGKAKDLEALRNAVVDAANVSAGLWFSYLFVLLYLVITVGSVTHRNLLFESPVKLPFLGVELPLLGFFILGPAIFLIVHAYVLLHFAMLADKVGVFHAELLAQIADEDIRTRLRRQLPSNIFVQFLAGPREVRTGLNGIMLRLIALVSLVIGPLALLVLLQIQFLPYHHEAVTWWQRIAVVADLALLWALWPSVARGETAAVGWRDFKRIGVIAAAAASLVPLVLVFTIATFPGEWLDSNLPSIRFVPGSSDKYGRLRWIGPHEYLFGGGIDFIARKPTSLWSNRLVLPNLDQPAENFSLRGRHLEGAVLLSASLRKMDFTAAQLQGAVFNDADLQEAKFLCAETGLKVGAESESESDDTKVVPEKHCAQLQSALFVRAKLQKASFAGAQLQRASFKEAQMQGAQLDDAHLQGATLDRAQLQRASLARAQMQEARLELTVLHGATLVDASLAGAWLDNVQLQGASLDGAHLEGAYIKDAGLHAASLRNARLQGAVLNYTHLDGAMMDSAELQGASLKGTHLYGASLYDAKLQGALMDDAQLQGAYMDSARFDGASLQHVFVWRTAVEREYPGGRIVAPKMEPVFSGWANACQNKEVCAWNPEKFTALRALITEVVPDGENRAQALRRIAVLDPATPIPKEEYLAKFWIQQAQSAPSTEDYDKNLLDVLQKVGCGETGAPFVIRGLLRTFDERFKPGDLQLRSLGAAFLDAANCPGARGLSEEDNKTLRSMRDTEPAPPGRRGRRGPQPAPKQ